MVSSFEESATELIKEKSPSKDGLDFCVNNHNYSDCADLLLGCHPSSCRGSRRSESDVANLQKSSFVVPSVVLEREVSSHDVSPCIWARIVQQFWRDVAISESILFSSPPRPSWNEFETLLTLNDTRRLEFVWVKGYATKVRIDRQVTTTLDKGGNDAADALASAAAAHHAAPQTLTDVACEWQRIALLTHSFASELLFIFRWRAALFALHEADHV